MSCAAPTRIEPSYHANSLHKPPDNAVIDSGACLQVPLSSTVEAMTMSQCLGVEATTTSQCPSLDEEILSWVADFANRNCAAGSSSDVDWTGLVDNMLSESLADTGTDIVAAAAAASCITNHSQMDSVNLDDVDTCYTDLMNQLQQLNG